MGRLGPPDAGEAVQGREGAGHEGQEPRVPDRECPLPCWLHVCRHEVYSGPLVPVGHQGTRVAGARDQGRRCFHTPMMQAAQEDLNKAIEKALPKMKPPRCSIYFNVTGKKVAAGTSPADFVDLMKKQLTNEVLWEPCIKQMIMDQVKDFYEVGPLKQIKSMIKRIDQDAFKRTENVSV